MKPWNTPWLFAKHAGNTEWIFGCLLHDECHCTVCLFVQSNTASDFSCAGDRHMVTHGDTRWHTVKLSFPIKNGDVLGTRKHGNDIGFEGCIYLFLPESDEEISRKAPFQQTECFPTIVPFSLQPYVAPQVLRYQLQKQTTWLFWRTMRLCSGFDGGLWANSRTLECLAAKKPLNWVNSTVSKCIQIFGASTVSPHIFLPNFVAEKLFFNGVVTGINPGRFGEHERLLETSWAEKPHAGQLRGDGGFFWVRKVVGWAKKGLPSGNLT